MRRSQTVARTTNEEWGDVVENAGQVGEDRLRVSSWRKLVQRLSFKVKSVR